MTDRGRWFAGGARGATLIELMVSLSIFSLALAGVFLLFRNSYQALHFLQNRQSVQQQMLKIKGWLHADFDLSHLRSIAVDPIPITLDDKNYRRDLVSCLALDDWRDKDSFHDITNMPLWNRYVLYQATDEEEGELVRLVLRRIKPPATGFLPFRPLEDLRGHTGFEVESRHQLSKNLLQYECEVSDADQDVRFNVKLLRRAGARGVDAKRAQESFEGVFRITPKNTHPKLSGGIHG